MSTPIVVEHLSKSFGDQRVIDDLTFTVPGGETTVILGPSGAGKSVLLKLVVGLLPPDAGSVTIEGKDVTRLPKDALYEMRRRVGMLFQDAALFDSMSVYDNVAFPLRRHTNKSEEEIASIVAEKLASVGLAAAGEKFPAELSGGMRKRAGLARAIALDPDVVFFDEPTSGLDPVTASAIDDLVLQMQAARPRTFMVISHDLDSTERIADWCGLLLGGKLVQFGRKSDVLASTHAAVRQFLDRKSDGPIRIV